MKDLTPQECIKNINIVEPNVKNIEKNIERYELLCKDVKYQIGFVDDFYQMDFTHLIEKLKEMKKHQEQITSKENYFHSVI